MQDFLLVYRLFLLLNGLLMWVRKDKQTYMHTLLKKKFKKPGVHMAGYWCALVLQN